MNYYEGDNFGGISKTEFIRNTDVLSMNPFTLKEGCTWLDIPIKSGRFTPKSADTENGPVHTYTVKFKIHNMRDEVDEALMPYLGQVAMIRVTDMNLRRMIIGAPGMPVELTIAGDTGENPTDENGTEFQAVVEQHFKAIKA